MSKLTICVLIAFFCVGCSSWDKTDIALEGVFFAAHGIDWAQTNNIANNPDKWHERNKILGKHPKVSEVNLVMGIMAVVQPVIAHILPSPYRRGWIIGTTVMKVATVINNVGVGIGWGF